MGDISIIQALLVFVVAFIMGIDQFSFLESLYQPIVTCPIIGAILGNFELGIVVRWCLPAYSDRKYADRWSTAAKRNSWWYCATIFAVSLTWKVQQTV